VLLDGSQSVVHSVIDVQDLDVYFFVFTGHKLYGPNAVGMLYGKAELLAKMPPYQGGGSMIDKVTFEKTTYAPAPTRFEAGTPHITGVVGLSAAIDYVQAIGLATIHAHECALVAKARSALDDLNSVRLFGPESSAGILSFEVQGVHPHDVGTILDEGGVAIRAGHHCAQPLMRHLGVEATARASFGLYSDDSDVDALVQGLARVRKIFG
ncbi:aminotransferase class V-fold PLP-dependent enzyme, partial [uncultured Sphingobium sp.]|uniref:aminotransferase class V-fold PLP-dependent enzyme n=1 Tax=uncultured Sphingobium sp. TaxID=316087 RepID=UPI002618EAAD